MNRRRVIFGIGLSLFQLSRRSGAAELDRLAARWTNANQAASSAGSSQQLDLGERPQLAGLTASPTSDEGDSSVAKVVKPTTDVRWKQNANRRWRWYERYSRRNTGWRLTGVTTPVNWRSREPYRGQRGYLDLDLVPSEVRAEAERTWKRLAPGRRPPTAEVVHAQPPSQWIRSLESDELSLWLGTLAVPPVGVEAMTFWTHLTRDHSFLPVKIAGLTDVEQAKLHAAAHYGY